MKKYMRAIVAVITLILTFNPLNAQDRWRWQLYSGMAFPIHHFDESEINNGFGFEGTVSYRFLTNLSAYSGWGWHQFSTDGSLDRGKVDIDETGFYYGIQYEKPIRQSSLSYFIRSGGIIGNIETEFKKDQLFSDSKYGMGWQVGTGVIIHLNNGQCITPSIRYRSLSRDLTLPEYNTSIDLSSWSIGLVFQEQLAVPPVSKYTC